MIKGYKVFNPNWKCRGFQYEVGKTYEEEVTPEVCNQGFHFCKRASDCFNYYDFDSENKVAEVIAVGAVDEGDDKCCTNKIEIVREIPWHELLTIVNLGKGNSGLCNSGNGNSGDRNSGNGNSGNRNSGNDNSGNRNSGNRNSGNDNSGNRNSGNDNSGDRNSGNGNSGNGNSGDDNSGNGNSGDDNSGDRNSGDRNSGNGNSGDSCTGDFNISDHETGVLCTEEHKIRFFDIESEITFEQWRRSDAYCLLCRINFNPTTWIYEEDMTDNEKENHPEYETTGGYLRKNNMDNAFLDWWKELDKNEKGIIKNIPNFNSEKFKQITGIDVSVDS